MPPVFIIGAPRSGTTFLGRVLSKDEAFAYAIEPSPVWRFGNEDRCDILKPEWITPKIRKHIHRSFEGFVRDQGKERLLEKTPQNSLRMPFLDALYPNALYIHIIRSGIESTLSIRGMWKTNTVGFRGVRIEQRLKEMTLRQTPRYARQTIRRIIGLARGRSGVMWGPLLPGLSQMVADLDPLEIAALQWRMCVELACSYGRTLPPERYFECRLEALDRNKFLEILDFARLSRDSEALAGFEEEYSQSRAQHRAKSATPEELRTLQQWIEPTETWLEARKGQTRLDAALEASRPIV